MSGFKQSAHKFKLDFGSLLTEEMRFWNDLLTVIGKSSQDSSKTKDNFSAKINIIIPFTTWKDSQRSLSWS